MSNRNCHGLRAAVGYVAYLSFWGFATYVFVLSVRYRRGSVGVAFGGRSREVANLFVVQKLKAKHMNLDSLLET